MENDPRRSSRVLRSPRPAGASRKERLSGAKEVSTSTLSKSGDVHLLGLARKGGGP